MPTAVVDGIPTRYEVTGVGPAAADVLPGRVRLRRWRTGRTVGIYRRLTLLEHLSASATPASPSTGASPAQSGGRVERITWARLRRRRAAGCSTTSASSAAHLMGGCVGLLDRRPRSASATRSACEHGAVLAGRRRAVPDEAARPVRAAPGVRRRARAGRGGRAGQQSGRRLQRGPAGRAVGQRASAPTRRSPPRTRARRGPLPACMVAGLVAAHVRPRHGAGRRSRRTCCCSTCRR